MLTEPDCTLQGRRIRTDEWGTLSPEHLAAIVGQQVPGDDIEDASGYDWRFTMMPIERLRCATQDYDEPEGGWTAAYHRHAAADARAVADGSPAYAGRQDWLRDVWARNTAIFPLFVVQEEDDLRLWDGHRRLAGAFHHGLAEVAVLLGTPKGLEAVLDRTPEGPA